MLKAYSKGERTNMTKRGKLLIGKSKPDVWDDQYQVSYMRVPNLVLSQCWACLSYDATKLDHLYNSKLDSSII